MHRLTRGFSAQAVCPRSAAPARSLRVSTPRATATTSPAAAAASAAPGAAALERHASSLPLVAMLDFMPDAEVEARVLHGVADVVCCQASCFDDIPLHIRQNAAAVLQWHLCELLPEHLAHFPKLRIISRVGAGFDNVPLEEAGRRNICVTNVPDYGTEEVADAAMSLLLSLYRKTAMLAARTGKAGVSASLGQQFPTHLAKGSRRIRGQRLGIVGLGRIGKAVAQRARAFGLELSFFDPFVERGIDKALGITRVASLEELLADSDVVSLHCWLDKSNRHMINEATLALMKRGSFLINTARGGLVHTAALVAALESGHVLGAGLDVLDEEPCVDPRLAALPNVVLTPHTAFYSDQSSEELRTKAAEECLRVLSGVPVLSPVNSLWMPKA